nr:A-kinase anchor protein 17B isoform X1 [Pogona vitticeps]XP_020669526.1 A-kinase anchor protein 17B isoform X1 [Pogona vitticeps]XP_020669527.1 A-kinase anchor protein 17B isoform X1 [Pogona vitticeps]
MTATLVCDPSEAMELCASQQLYLKPVAKLTISVVLPEHTSFTRAFSKWEVMDKLKNMICPDQFTSVKVSKSTKGFIRFEGEAETKRLICSLKEKLHGKMIKLNGFKDDLQVVATEVLPDFATPRELETNLNGREMLEEDSTEQRKDVPDCLHLEGLPCKWFALKGSDSETPSEDVLREVFESFGKIKNIDIPMLDPYREEMVGGRKNNFTFRGLRIFDAFVQYQESASFSKAMEALKGMKLMFKGDDGKALACNIKVTSDTSRHFSETAINQRNLERLTLQGLERERKREENRGKKGTERKRCDDDGDDDGKKGEGKRKSKIKKRGKRQIERDEKRPRKQQKVTAGEELWPENMPEWEERKYLLAQRRVESIRLLTVLLSQIKNFVLSSRQVGEPPVNTENEREDLFPTPPTQKALKQKTNSCYFGHQDVKDEKVPECHSADLDNSHVWEGEKKHVTSEEPTSPCPLIRTVLNKPVGRVITSHLTEKDTDCHRAGGLIQVTITQDCKVEKSPNRGDYLQPNLRCFSEAMNASKGRKPKVYETEEFIHYLLNYYQTPRYARICPQVQNPVDKSRWQRVVSYSGNGFQVSLKNKDGKLLTKLNLVPNPHEGDSRESDSRKREVIDKEPKPLQIMPNSQARTGEFAKSYQWDDALEDTSNKTPQVQWNAHVVGNPGIACDIKHQKENTGITMASSHKPFGHVYKLKDLLEEISSDSEYFSETFNEPLSKTERRNGGCRSSCEVWPLGPQKARELLICVQNVACGSQDSEGTKRSFCSSFECYDSTKNPRQKLKMTFKRFSSNVRHEGQKTKWLSSEDEREASRRKKKKKKKRPSSNSLPDDEPSFLKVNHCGELESLSKIQRKYTKGFHHKMKCKALPAVKAKDVLRLTASQLQESHQGAGDLLLRREVGEDSEGWPLFPVEIIQKSPYPESLCGTDLGRGC